MPATLVAHSKLLTEAWFAPSHLVLQSFPAVISNTFTEATSQYLLGGSI